MAFFESSESSKYLIYPYSVSGLVGSIPIVTIASLFSFTNSFAFSSVLTNFFSFPIVWSEGRTAIFAFLYICFIYKAESNIHGAVFLPSGSIIIC